MAETVDQKRHDALANRDAAKYFRYCNELGVEPEAPELYEVGQVEYEQIRPARSEESGLVRTVNASPKTQGKTTSPRRNKFDYVKFREAVESNGYYNASNPFVNIDSKRELLKRFGVKRLYVAPKETVPIEKAKDTRVGRVFKDYYERSLRIA